MIETYSDLLRSPSAIFGKCSEAFVWPSKQFWKIFGNLRKVVENLGKIKVTSHLRGCPSGKNSYVRQFQ